MKFKTLLISMVLLAATFYAGIMVDQREKSDGSKKIEKAAPQYPQYTQDIVVRSSTTSTPALKDADANSSALLPNSAASRLNPGELSALIQNNPVAAGYARDITDDLNFHDLAKRIAKNWAAKDPQAALSWAQGLPAGSVQNDAVDIIFTIYALNDSKSAWTLAQSLTDDGPSGARARALADVAMGTSAQDPAQAAQMLATLGRVETSISSNNPTGSVAAAWLLQDPQSASRWIDTLPVGTNKDSAILALVEVEGKNDPASTFPWLRTMSNASARGTATTKFITQWAKTDPDAATAAVMQAYPKGNPRQVALLSIIQQTANSQANSQ